MKLHCKVHLGSVAGLLYLFHARFYAIERTLLHSRSLETAIYSNSMPSIQTSIELDLGNLDSVTLDADNGSTPAEVEPFGLMLYTGLVFGAGKKTNPMTLLSMESAARDCSCIGII